MDLWICLDELVMDLWIYLDGLMDLFRCDIYVMCMIFI
jgi:hypothetical protein